MHVLSLYLVAPNVSSYRLNVILFCARSSCYAQKGKKRESYVSSARAVHSFHTVQISAVSKRLLFARKLSIFETQHLSYLLLVLCMKDVLTRPRRAKGTTQQPEDGRGDLRGLTSERDSHSATLRRPGLICHHQRWGKEGLENWIVRQSDKEGAPLEHNARELFYEGPRLCRELAIALATGIG